MQLQHLAQLDITAEDYAALYTQLQREYRDLCRAHQLLQARAGQTSAGQGGPLHCYCDIIACVLNILIGKIHIKCATYRNLMIKYMGH